MPEEKLGREKEQRGLILQKRLARADFSSSLSQT